MSVYSDLLRLALVEDDGAGYALPELIGLLLSRRTDLESANGARGLEAAEKLSASLAYDAALVALCRRLGVPETLTCGAEITAARHRAEEGLAGRLPSVRNLTRT